MDNHNQQSTLANPSAPLDHLRGKDRINFALEHLRNLLTSKWNASLPDQTFPDGTSSAPYSADNDAYVRFLIKAISNDDLFAEIKGPGRWEKEGNGQEPSQNLLAMIAALHDAKVE